MLLTDITSAQFHFIGLAISGSLTVWSYFYSKSFFGKNSPFGEDQLLTKILLFIFLVFLGNFITEFFDI